MYRSGRRINLIDGEHVQQTTSATENVAQRSGAKINTRHPTAAPVSHSISSGCRDRRAIIKKGLIVIKTPPPRKHVLDEAEICGADGGANIAAEYRLPQQSKYNPPLSSARNSERARKEKLKTLKRLRGSRGVASREAVPSD
ncbi:unnamed protein product [Arctogadus glacialis]